MQNPNKRTLRVINPTEKVLRFQDIPLIRKESIETIRGIQPILSPYIRNVHIKGFLSQNNNIHALPINATRRIKIIRHCIYRIFKTRFNPDNIINIVSLNYFQESSRKIRPWTSYLLGILEKTHGLIFDNKESITLETSRMGVEFIFDKNIMFKEEYNALLSSFGNIPIDSIQDIILEILASLGIPMGADIGVSILHKYVEIIKKQGNEFL